MVLGLIHVHIFYFQILNFDWGENVTNFGVNKISITHSDNSYLV